MCEIHYPVRILQVIGHMDRGGAETMIMNLYRNIDRSRIQFDFVQHYDKAAAFDQEILQLGGKIYHCPVYKPQTHRTYVHWWNEFFLEHPSEYPIVHGHIGSTAAIYLKIAKSSGAITIAHSHSALQGSIAYRVYSYPTRWIADYFFGCGTEAICSRYGKQALQSGRVQVIRNGIDLGNFSYSEDSRIQIRKRYSVPLDALVVGHVGRFSEVKNHDLLIRIFRLILQNHPNAYLLLVGDGPLKSNVKAKAEKMGISDNVIFAGVQRNTGPYYSAMDLFVFPSLGEGLPVSLVEAQAASLPCLVSNTIPKESSLIPELIHWYSLNDSEEVWADGVEKCFSLKRGNRSDELMKAGYDIRQTSRELQMLYQEMLRKDR